MVDHPECVYRLATRAEWNEALETGVVPKRDIDERDGYVHLSTRDQALETASLHFRGVKDLLALEIPIAPIANAVKFERAPKRGQDFPHLYGVLRADHVARVIALRRVDTGFAFGETL